LDRFIKRGGPHAEAHDSRSRAIRSPIAANSCLPANAGHGDAGTRPRFAVPDLDAA
jgi:hypothetical protein